MPALTIHDILTGLQSFGATVAKPGGGVLSSYDLTNFFDQRLGVELPCLTIAPTPNTATTWKTLTMMGNMPTITVALDHILLYETAQGSADKSAIMPNLYTTVDNYFAALAALPFLTTATAPSIHYSAKPEFRFHTVIWGDTKYLGGVFSYLFTCYQ